MASPFASILKGESVSGPSIFISTNSPPEYPLGTRKRIADGRTFYYCKDRKKGPIFKDGQVVGIGTGDGWMQTWGACIVGFPVICGNQTNMKIKQTLVHLNISP